ncbi:CoA transferase [bacterium]|nr:CoA transferase [bacterium]
MIKASGTPLPRLSAAPALGADTLRVLSEPCRTPSAPELVTPAPTARPLEGVKILDFMWVMAGPAGTRVLADMGATVVRIESNARIDTARTLQPFKDNTNSLESSALFSNMNAGKLGVTINPTTPEGMAVIEDLIRWADVVTESYSPRAMVNFGLDYESVRKINPSVIMLSSCLFGQTGPLAKFAGYGTMAAAMTGFFGITGWPDRAPSGPFGAYTDYISPRFANAALLAALDHRRRTGEGQYLDFAQAEGSMHVIAPLLLDYTINGKVASTVGNSDARCNPHGVFPSQGEDRWVAIACETDEQRAALGALTGGLDDAAITAWTQVRTDADAELHLQAVGVPAHRVADNPSMVEDPQLIERGHFIAVPHASLGEVVVEGPKYRLSRTPAIVGQPPTLGQHTAEVLTDILGYDEERMISLLISGAME